MCRQLLTRGHSSPTSLSRTSLANVCVCVCALGSCLSFVTVDQSSGTPNTHTYSEWYHLRPWIEVNESYTQTHKCALRYAKCHNGMTEVVTRGHTFQSVMKRKEGVESRGLDIIINYYIYTVEVKWRNNSNLCNFKEAGNWIFTPLPGFVALKTKET